MTNFRAVAHLGMGVGGWTEHTTTATNLISLAGVPLNAFSKLRHPESRCSANLDSSAVLSKLAISSIAPLVRTRARWRLSWQPFLKFDIFGSI
jgi:hypothetical protein